jgi:hypothetical protein
VTCYIIDEEGGKMTDNPFQGEWAVTDIETWAREFDDLCNSRMDLGREKYGDFTWLQAPTFDMILEEMADQVNYLRFSAVKIRLMQAWLANKLQDSTSSGFVPSNPERQ